MNAWYVVDIECARRRSIMSTIGVASLIRPGELPARVPDGVVDGSQVAEHVDSFDGTLRLRPRDPVWIAARPFADLVGRIQSLASGERVRILLEILGCKVPTMLDAAEVVPV